MKIFLTLFISLSCCLCLSAQTKNAEKAFNKGLDYFQEQAYTEALDQFKSVIWADPDHEAAHHFLAQIYTAQGKSSFAIKHLKRVLAINSQREDSWIDLANAYAVNDQNDKAISTLEKAVKVNPAFASAKTELDNLLHPSVAEEPEIMEEAIAYEPVEPIIQPPSTGEIVSISDEPSILVDKPSNIIVSSMTKPIVVPVYEADDDIAVLAPIAKEEVMAPATTSEKPKKLRKSKKEFAGASETEEMAAAVLDELLPAFEAEEEVEEVVLEENNEKVEEVLTKEDIKNNVTDQPNIEVVEEEEVAEEVVPSFSGTPRIPGIRMPSGVDHVIKAQSESKRSKKRKN